MNADEPLGLDNYMAESHRAGGMAAAVAFPDETAHDRVLRETAALGVDLLTGEEPHSPLKKGTGSEPVDVYSK